MYGGTPICPPTWARGGARKSILGRLERERSVVNFLRFVPNSRTPPARYITFAMSSAQSKVTSSKIIRKVIYHPETPESTPRKPPPSLSKDIMIWEDEEGYESPILRTQKSRSRVSTRNMRRMGPSSPTAVSTKGRAATRRILREVIHNMDERSTIGLYTPMSSFTSKGHRYNLRPRPSTIAAQQKKSETIKPIGWRQLFKDQSVTKLKTENSKVVDDEDPFA